MIFFSHCPGVASRETVFPRYPHVLPPLRGAGALRRNVRVPSPVPSPDGDIHHGPVHGENPGENRVQANS